MKDKSKSIAIRPATAMDSVNIVRLISEGYEQTPAKEMGKLDEQKLLEYVTTTLRHARPDQGAGFVLVAHQSSNRVLGTIGVAPIRVPWCNAVVMAETWFAVTQAYRARGVPEELLQVVERFLDSNRLVGFLGSQMLTPADMNQVIARRERQGYYPSRHTFLRIPCRYTNEKGQPIIPPKVASA